MCRRFHREGWNVVIHYNTSGRDAQHLAIELNSLRPDSAKLAHGSLADFHGYASLAAQGSTAFGHVNALINNASVFHRDADLAGSEAAWVEMLQINAFGPYQLSLALKDELAKTGGSIINLVDVRATAMNPAPGWDVYYASKAALHSLTISSARLLAPEIRVNGISPGSILPPPWVDEHTPMVRPPTALAKEPAPEDIASAAYWLASAAHVTGQIIAVDGGESLNW